MKSFLFLILTVFFLSCNNSSKKEYKAMYSQILSYQKDLNRTIDAQYIYVKNKSESDSIQMRKLNEFDVLDKQISDVFEKNRYEKDVDFFVNKRDSINTKYMLGLSFPKEHYSNLEDSISKKLIEIDFLKIRKAMQNHYLFVHPR